MTKGDSDKSTYFTKVQTLFKEYSKIFVVNIDNVTSNQMHNVRKAVRGEAIVLMGKNTLIRRAMREIIDEIPSIECILNILKGNVALIFTNNDLKTIRDKVISFKVAAPAKVNAISPVDVIIPAGGTSISPDKTSFFQALGIPTKVVKGCIEIVTETVALKVGAVVNHSQVELLNMMGIMPFSYGITILNVFDNGTLFDPSMLDIADKDIINHICTAIRDIASLSLATKIPSVAAVPHILANTYKDVLSVGLECDNISFAALDKLRDCLKNPQAAAVSASAEAPSKSAAAAKVEEKEESDEDAGFGLFD